MTRVPQQGPQQDALTVQDWLTLDRIEQTLTTIGAITADDAKWLIGQLTKLAKATARIDPPVPSPGDDTDASDEMLTLATIIDKRIYPTTPTVRVLARDYLRLRAAAVVPSPSAPAPVARLYEAKRRVYQLAESIKSASLDAVAEEIDRGIAEVESAWRAVSSSSVADSPTCNTVNGCAQCNPDFPSAYSASAEADQDPR